MGTSFLKKMLAQASVAIGVLLTASILPAFSQAHSTLRLGVPGRRISSTPRCDHSGWTGSPIIALTPPGNLTKTISTRPSLYFVLPVLEESRPFEFSLRDSEDNVIYEETVYPDTTEKIIGIQLPENTLQVGQDYIWSFTLFLNDQARGNSLTVSGRLRQVPPEFSSERDFNTTDTHSLADELGLANRYQSADLWNDAISTVVALRQRYPEDPAAKTAWVRLLQDLDLDSYMQSS